MFQNKPFCLWFTGLSGSGKSTLVNALIEGFNKHYLLYDIFDGDEIRTHLSKGLGFSIEDRLENINRVAYVASKVVKNNGIALVSCITPYQVMRDSARDRIKNFILVGLTTELQICEQRDPKGLYKKARNGEIKNFTGIDDKFEPITNADIYLDTETFTIQQCVSTILEYLETHFYLMKNKRRALYIGRWQPFHNGHDFIIQKKLSEGIPVAIGIRNTPISESDPYTMEERLSMIKSVYEGQDVHVFPMPDIESVCIGRAVGYNIEHYEVPTDISGISATQIRNKMRNSDDSWKKFVPKGEIKVLEEIHNYRNV